MTSHLAALVTGEQFSQLLGGLGVSLKVAGLALLFGFPFGILLATGVMSRRRSVSYATIVVVEILRGMPALVLLALLYYGLPDKGITLTAFIAAVIGLALNTGAYTSEIFRTALRAVPAGQREASASIGMSEFATFRTVVLPQALRIALPQLVSFSILVFQGTALCFSIALPELLSSAYGIGSITFRYLEVLVVAAAMYAVISIPMSQLAGWLERRATARL